MPSSSLSRARYVTPSARRDDAYCTPLGCAAWIVRQYGRERRATVATHSAAVRAFVRYLARRGLLGPGVTYEQMRENVREVMGRGSYKSPRIDRRLPLLVTHVMETPIPTETERGGVKRLEALRDRALMLVLFCSGMRRAEV